MKMPSPAGKRTAQAPVPIPIGGLVAERISRPTATATIDPMGHRGAGERDHSIKVLIGLNASDPRYADKGQAAATARRSLDAYSPRDGERDRRTFREVTHSRKGKAGTFTTVVVAVEGSAVWTGRPADETVEILRASLVAEGYRVTLRERRECVEPACSTDAMVDWGQTNLVPSGWFSNEICGGHNYRRCAKCHSIFVLTATNAAGQAPSVHCEVCGLVLVEWGSSKIWDAVLVTRGDLPH
jgi:hypothetical protein